MNQLKFELIKELYTRATSNIGTQMGFVVLMFFYYQAGQKYDLKFVFITALLASYIVFRYKFNCKTLKKINSQLNGIGVEKIHNSFTLIVFLLSIFWAIFTLYPVLFLNATLTKSIFPFAGFVMAAMGAMGISGRDLWAFLSLQIGAIFYCFIKNDSDASLVYQTLLLVVFCVYLLNQQKSVYKLWANFIFERFDQQYLLNGFPGFICLIKNDRVTFSNELYEKIKAENSDLFSNLIQKHIFDFLNESLVETSFEVPILLNSNLLEHRIILQKTPEKQIILVGLNIQNQKDKEKQIKEQQALLDQSAKMAALGEMSGGIAHEINNPLTVITINSAQIRRILTKTSSALQETDLVQSLMTPLTKIDNMVQRISKIIKSLRTFARDGSADPFETVQLISIVDDTLTFCESKFKQSEIEIIKNIDPEIEIRCRSTEISQVLLNLFNNAYDAMINSKISTRKKCLTISSYIKNKIVYLTVQDTGDGIPQSLRDKIMQPFFTTKDVGQGTGLGLSISRSIMISHHGQIYFDFNSPHTTVVLEFNPSSDSQ